MKHTLIIILSVIRFNFYAQTSPQDSLKAAVQNYTKAIAANPKDVNAYFHRGLSKGLLDDYKSAIDSIFKNGVGYIRVRGKKYIQKIPYTGLKDTLY